MIDKGKSEFTGCYFRNLKIDSEIEKRPEPREEAWHKRLKAFSELDFLAHWVSTKNRAIWVNTSLVVCIGGSEILHRTSVFWTPLEEGGFCGWSSYHHQVSTLFSFENRNVLNGILHSCRDIPYKNNIFDTLVRSRKIQNEHPIVWPSPLGIIFYYFRFLLTSLLYFLLVFFFVAVHILNITHTQLCTYFENLTWQVLFGLFCFGAAIRATEDMRMTPIKCLPSHFLSSLFIGWWVDMQLPKEGLDSKIILFVVCRHLPLSSFGGSHVYIQGFGPICPCLYHSC